MKTLNEFAAAHNLLVIPVTYRAQGIRLRRKGFDLVMSDTRKDINGKPFRHIIVSFEPYHAEKWYLRHAPATYKGRRYVNRITKKLLAGIPLEKSFFVIS